MLVLPNHADPRVAQGSLWYANHFFTRPLSVPSLLYHVSLRHPYPESRFALSSQFRSQTVSDLPLSSFAGPRTLCNACGLTYAKMVRDSNNRVRLQHRRPLHSAPVSDIATKSFIVFTLSLQNKKTAGTKELDSTGATTLSLSAPHQTSSAEAGPSYSNRYAGMQSSGSGMPHAGANTRGSPIDIDLHAGSDSSDELLELDADLERAGDPDLAGDEMDEDEGSEKRTPPTADRSDFTTAMAGPGNGHCGPHSQRTYHPNHG